MFILQIHTVRRLPNLGNPLQILAPQLPNVHQTSPLDLLLADDADCEEADWLDELAEIDELDGELDDRLE